MEAKASRQIVAIVGLCGSGKSEVCSFFQNRGYKTIYFGGLTMEELKKREWAVTPANERMVREELRKQYGMAAYALLAEKKIDGILKQGERVLIDGLYSFSEYKLLKAKYGQALFVIAVYSPPQIRYERLSKRKKRPLTEKEAKERDYSEIENIEKGGPIAMADATLINEGTLRDLKKQLNGLNL